MFLHSRRFCVWLVSFLAVLVVYFIYNRMTRTPPIAASGSAGVVADVCDANGTVGMVGGVGVATVKNVLYTKLNAAKQVEREFGFEELLHQDGNDWEIERPFVRVYRPNFKCEISGERARVVVEGMGKDVTPTEGVMSGNVTIKIWPKGDVGLGESVIYLDDVRFDNERSLFSTEGLVDFVSDRVHLAGEGLELVYNGEIERLELLKIARLKSLHIRNWTSRTVLGVGVSPEGQARQKQDKGSEAGQKQDKGSEAGQKQDKDSEAGQKLDKDSEGGQKYRCVLDKNVVIESAKERLLTGILSINDIFVASGKEGGAEEKAVPGTGQTPSTGQTQVLAGGNPDQSGRASPAETGEDVAISCAGSVLITPMDSATGAKWLKEKLAAAPNVEQIQDVNRDGKTVLKSGRIDFNAATGDAAAIGPSRIIFDAAGNAGGDVNTPATVTVVSQKQASFERAANRAVFEGNCRCTVSQKQGDATREYIVLADKLEVGLRNAGGEKDKAAIPGIGRLVARGGDVRLASTKRIGERLLGGIELKCAQMDYNTVSGDFSAAGPGLIKVDNSQTDESQKGLGRFSLRRKCYAFLRQFDSLQFDGAENRLVADSKGGSILVDYFPLEDRRSKEKVAITASHIDAKILESAQGRMELGELLAKGAVSYEDKDMEFAGNEFVYDAETGVINVRGDELRPVIFNGAIVPAVRYDTKTGKVNTRITAPGALRERVERR